jgi:predicted glycosyltransferase
MGYRNITIQPINNEAFIESMASAEGILCGAGFETPAEALYMHKKLMVIPMKGQYEQHCNAAALKEMGVPVLKSLKLDNIDKIKNWIEQDSKIEVDYPDSTEEIINKILATYSTSDWPQVVVEKQYTVKKFRNLILKKIVAQL